MKCTRLVSGNKFHQVCSKSKVLEQKNTRSYNIATCLISHLENNTIPVTHNNSFVNTFVCLMSPLFTCKLFLYKLQTNIHTS